MGRHKKYRNAAEKQKAYRARKIVETWSDDLISKVDVLRKNAQYLKDKKKWKPTLEVYRTIFGDYTYKLMGLFYEWLRIDEETFNAIKPELELVRKSRDTEVYKFREC